jgi:hypothetical protein
MEHFGYWDRHELMRLTTKSGVAANLRLLAVGPYGPHEVGVAGCSPTSEVFAAAAEAGHMPNCQLLMDLGCTWDDIAAAAAARGGHTDNIQWLREAACNHYAEDDGQYRTSRHCG